MGIPKFLQRAQEIRESVPAAQLPQVISELKLYLKLRRLSEIHYEYLPENLREEIGTADPMDAFNEAFLRDEDLEGLWDTLSDKYGYDPDARHPKWTISELVTLIEELER